MSGRLIQAKKIRFHERPRSKTVQRSAALKRVHKRNYLMYLEKIGELEKELEKMRGRRRRR